MLFGNYLEEQTQRYWELSLATYGRSSTSITTGQAIDKANILRFSLGPQRRLATSIGCLMDILIAGRPRKSKNKVVPIPMKTKDHQHA